MRKGSTIIQEMRQGALDQALGEAINEVTERVKATGKPGMVMLAIKIENADEEATEVERVWLTDQIKTKLPALPQKNSLFFITENNDLTRTPPQAEIPGVKTPEIEKKLA